MKKALAIFTALVVMPASQTLAWTGGPFSNNSRFTTGDDGIYEAIATTSNGMGIYRFAVRNTGTSAEPAGSGGTNPNGSTTLSSNVQFSAGLLGSSSSNVWYYKGITYYGPAFGTVNSDAGVVACVGNAQSNQPNTGGLQGQAGNTGAVNQPNNGGANGVYIRGPQGNNIGYANSSFLAKIETPKEAPTVRFKGSGEVSFVGEATTIAEVEAINPVLIAPGGDFSTIFDITAGGSTAPPGNVTFATGSVTQSGTTSPGGGTTTSDFDSAERNISFSGTTRVSTGGEDSEFGARGHTRKFVVFGSRVSATVTP